MCHASNEKQEMIDDGGNRTTKSRKNHNALRKRNLQVLGNIGDKSKVGYRTQG